MTFTLPTPAAKVEVMFEGREPPASGNTFADAFALPYTVHVYRVTLRRGPWSDRELRLDTAEIPDDEG